MYHSSDFLDQLTPWIGRIFGGWFWTWKLFWHSHQPSWLRHGELNIEFIPNDSFLNKLRFVQVVIGHNEDTNPLTYDRGFIVNAKFSGTDQEFTSYSYPGM
jgi:hypothetical protein